MLFFGVRWLKTFFKGWNWFEISFLAAAFIIPITVGLVSKSSAVEILASMFSLIVAILFAKAKVHGYFLSFISMTFYIIVSFQARLYGEIMLSLIIDLPVAIYGISCWLKNKYNDKAKGTVVKIGHTGFKELSLLLASQLIMSIGYYFILKAFNTEFLIVSTISIITSIMGAYLVARRSQLGLFGWILNDIVMIILWTFVFVNGGSLVLLIMPCMFLINDIYGTFSWYRLKKRQTENAEKPSIGNQESLF